VLTVYLLFDIDCETCYTLFNKGQSGYQAVSSNPYIPALQKKGITTEKSIEEIRQSIYQFQQELDATDERNRQQRLQKQTLIRCLKNYW
jgi:hypothetical protein